jgi:osmotically-inducible protein OsmY
MFTSRRLAVLLLAAALSSGALAESSGGKCASTDCLGDANIRAEVQKKLNEQPSLKFFDIHVMAADRAVYLSGIVDTRADRSRAAAIARAVPGVSKVYNDLALSGNGN